MHAKGNGDTAHVPMDGASDGRIVTLVEWSRGGAIVVMGIGLVAAMVKAEQAEHAHWLAAAVWLGVIVPGAVGFWWMTTCIRELEQGNPDARDVSNRRYLRSSWLSHGCSALAILVVVVIAWLAGSAAAIAAAVAGAVLLHRYQALMFLWFGCIQEMTSPIAATIRREAERAGTPCRTFLLDSGAAPRYDAMAVPFTRWIFFSRGLLESLNDAEVLGVAHHEIGHDHPVQDLRTGHIDITSHNHGFAVREERKGERRQVAGVPELEITHVNLYDGTVEGFRHVERPLFAVQYHPEAAPGPHDAAHHFDEFVRSMKARRGRD